jgi:hypothetical protein
MRIEVGEDIFSHFQYINASRANETQEYGFLSTDSKYSKHRAYLDDYIFTRYARYTPKLPFTWQGPNIMAGKFHTWIFFCKIMLICFQKEGIVTAGRTTKGGTEVSRGLRNQLENSILCRGIFSLTAKWRQWNCEILRQASMFVQTGAIVVPLILVGVHLVGLDSIAARPFVIRDIMFLIKNVLSVGHSWKMRFKISADSWNLNLKKNA